MRQFEHGVWVKCDGSGGDTVIRIATVTADAVASAVALLRQRVRDAVALGASANEVIDPDSGLPRGGVVVEADVRACGTPVVNASCTVYTDARGTVQLRGVYRQETPLGRWTGSSDLLLDADLTDVLCDLGMRPDGVLELVEHNARVVGEAALHAGYYGLHGQDFFIVRNQRGRLEVINTEINGRIPNSGIAAAVAAHAGASWFSMCDAYALAPCTTLAEFRDLVTVDGTSHLDGRADDRAVWPMAFASRWSVGPTGVARLEHRSDRVRLLFLAASPETLRRLRRAVLTRFRT